MAGTPSEGDHEDPALVAPGAGEGTDSPTTERTGGPDGLRRTRLILVAVVVVLVLILAGVLYSHALLPASPSPGSGSTVATADTYLQAKSSAANYSHTPSGDWLLVSAVGVASPTALLYGGSGEPGCAIPPVYIPSSAAVLAGTAPFWIFDYVGEGFPGSPAALLLTVVNGSAGLLAEWSGGTQCTEGFQEFESILEISIDSPQIAMDAAAAGGATFTNSQPGTAAIYTLAGGYGPGAPPIWSVRYDPCGFLGVGVSLSGTEPYAEEAYYANNGTRYAHGFQNSTETCASSGPHPVTIGSTSVYQPSNKSGWYYNVTLQLGTALPLNDVGVLVNTSGGSLMAYNNFGEPWNPPPAGDLWEAPPSANEWYCILSTSAHSTVGVYPTQFPGQPITWEDFGAPPQLVASGDVLTIIASDALSGDTVSIFGVNGVMASGSQQL